MPVVVHHWICQQFDDVPEFPVIKTQMGPKHRAAPLLSSLSGSIRSTDTMVGTRQCFSNGNNAFKHG